MTIWACSYSKWLAVAPWQPSTFYAIGNIVRQRLTAEGGTTPTLGMERCFRTTTAGTTGLTGTEPNWSTSAKSKGVTVSDNGTLVWTEISGNPTYNTTPGTWTAPFARLWRLMNDNWALQDDVIYVDVATAETQAASIDFPQAVGIGKYAVSITPSTGVYTPGARVTVTGTSNITFLGGTTKPALMFGFDFVAGSGNGNRGDIILRPNLTSSSLQDFRDCKFRLDNTNASSQFATGWDICANFLSNCSLQFGHTSQKISVGRAMLTWDNAANGTATPVLISGNLPSGNASAVPAILFGDGDYWRSGRLNLKNLDFVASGLTNPLINATSLRFPHQMEFLRCVIPAGSLCNGYPSRWGTFIDCVESDVGTDFTRTERYQRQGTLTTDTVFRGGGVDRSWKIVTNPSSTAVIWDSPFEAFPLETWNTITGDVLVTIYGCTNDAMPTNADLWIEAFYFGDAASTQGAFKTTGLSTRQDDYGDPTATTYIADASDWSGSPTNKFRIDLTLTSPSVEAVGLIDIRLKIAASNKTYWFDPHVYLAAGALTAPSISGAAVTAVTADGATPEVTVNKAATIYSVLIPNGDLPSDAQIAAGLQSSGAAAYAAASHVMAAAGTYSFGALTGAMSGSTAYDARFVAHNSAGYSSQSKVDFTTAASGIPPTGTYQDEGATDISTGNSVFAAADIGTADVNRKVIAIYIHRVTDGPWSPSGLNTIGGVAATMHVNQSDGDQAHIQIFSADVPTGTTADVVVGFAAAPWDAGVCSVFTMDRSLAALVPTTGSQPGGITNTVSAGFADTLHGCVFGGLTWTDFTSKSATVASPMGSSHVDSSMNIFSENDSDGAGVATGNWTGNYTSIIAVVAWAPA